MSLLNNYAPIPESGCWIWLGHWNRKGYGKAKDRCGKFTGVHRIFYEYYVGPIPSGMQVCHKCDTRACCNPSHLVLGSNQFNVDDCVSKGRRFTKLTPSQVTQIRSGGNSDRGFAKLFGVHKNTIRLARIGDTWNECMREEYEKQ